MLGTMKRALGLWVALLLAGCGQSATSLPLMADPGMGWRTQPAAGAQREPEAPTKQAVTAEAAATAAERANVPGVATADAAAVAGEAAGAALPMAAVEPQAKETRPAADTATSPVV